MTQRKFGSFNSRTYKAILDAAEEIMIESGYAAVTSRNVGTKAGLKSNLVHYYFRTMDDLFVAVYRRFAEEFALRRKEILKSEKPLRSLWETTSDPRHITIIYEFVALGNHRKEVRAEIAKFGTQLRDIDVDIVRDVLGRKGLGQVPWLPPLLTIILESVARNMALHRALGITSGQKEALGTLESLIELLEG